MRKENGISTPILLNRASKGMQRDKQVWLQNMRDKAADSLDIDFKTAVYRMST